MSVRSNPTIPTEIAAEIKAAPSCAHCSADLTAAPQGARSIALVGAPNAGKSTLFNALTGANVKTGNWPGTSVEVARGAWRPVSGGEIFDLIDFPGTYSMEPMSPDEALTREMLLERPAEEHPHAVIVVVDASTLSRGLYLAAQLAEHRYRIIIALTKVDVAQRRNTTIDPAVLSQEFGVPVIPVDARHGEGIQQLSDAVVAQLQEPVPLLRSLPEGVDRWSDQAADLRFSAVDSVVKKAQAGQDITSTATDKVDRVVLDPVAGPLIFLLVMYLVFAITTTVAAPLQDFFEGIFTGPVASGAQWLLTALHLDHPLVVGLVIDGFIGGVGMVLSFAPLIALMFLCLAVLEDSGYMARAAVVTDRLMKSIGLPGKAFIPIVVGFGCNVPAISATRVLGNFHHRVLTSILIPFTSCSARLIVFLMLATVFFPERAGLVVFFMYVLSIALIVLVGLLLRHTLWRSIPDEPLIIDLPTYQFPTLRLTSSVVWTRVKAFLADAGSIIVITVVAVWLLMSIPVTGEHSLGSEDLPVEDSAYGAVAAAMAPVFEPAGFGSWSLTGPLITGFVAKEAVISTWAQTYGVADVTDDSADAQADSALAQKVRQDFDQASEGRALPAVWAFMVFMLAYTPCVATLAAQRKEIGLKWTLFGFVVQLVGSWLLAVGVFQVLAAVMS